MYKRKTKDEWIIQGYYDSYHKWEDVTTEETFKAARITYREYRDNEPQYAHRIKLKRVPIDNQ